jgi:hypothetical protein
MSSLETLLNNLNANGTFAHTPLDSIEPQPHPSTFAKVRIDEMTPWMPSDDAKPVPKSNNMSVICCIAEAVNLDDYDMEQNRQPIVMHRFYNEKMKRWDNDIATSALSASGYMVTRSQDRVTPGLKDRFGTAIAAYEKRLVREGRPLPIALVADKIYPEVLNACECRGVFTVNAIASADKSTLAKVEQHLRNHGQTRHADNMKRFQQIAREKLDALGVEYDNHDAKPVTTRKAS